MKITVIIAAILTTPLAFGENQPEDTITTSIGMKLAFIPPGEVTMGSPEDEPGRIVNEKQQKVTFKKGLHIGVTEVTQKQWREVMGSNPSYFKGDELPVERITWPEAVEFCRLLGEREKKKFRLPTAAEWEYACRAGTTTAYHSGRDKAALEKAGWFRGNSGNKSHKVGLKEPNRWGLRDMHGNVAEWCAARPGAQIYKTNSAQLDQEEKSLRDHRGGSWGLGASDCRAAARHRNAASYRYFDLGLRVVCELK